ncbi:MAG: putative lipid II flippase FtsW [Acidimicrobiales bacterium]|nr:putative lipid II flippase FtsW [Acidimicrobiia bacterium]HAQ03311.1 putative lipid II flippase FtsW [Acidimicrobiaceae bacterium]|tara:strand:+ start:263 stop:1417 length:1155 start_codon:yes stop_codon:yes gene_type:complete
MNGKTSTGKRKKLLNIAANPPGFRSLNFVVLIAAMIVLTLLGVVMVLSASSVNDLRIFGDTWHHLKRQVLWLFLGISSMAVTMRIDYRKFRKFSIPFLLLSLILCGLVLFPSVGITANGSARWIGIGSFTFQPSEFLKIAMVIYLADLFSGSKKKTDVTFTSIKKFLLVLGTASALLMLEPDLGTTAIVAAISLSILFFSGFRIRNLFLMGISGGALLFVASYSSGYRRKRLLGVLDPWQDPTGIGWQALQSAVAISQGGVSGLGLGESRAKWGFLPFSHTDFIFAIVAEELGFIGACLVILAFLSIGLAGLASAFRAPDNFGQLLAAGITAWISIQAFVNLGAVLGMLPITGVPLPFVSSGGSSLVVTMAAFGILLNVARQTR